jgi:hypothetical protein
VVGDCFVAVKLLLAMKGQHQIDATDRTPGGRDRGSGDRGSGGRECYRLGDDLYGLAEEEIAIVEGTDR